MAMLSSDDAAQQRTTRSPGLQVPPQREMLGRHLQQVVRHDITDELNEEAAITNAQVQRAEQMCLARNAKNRAKRERKREKVRAATVDALFNSTPSPPSLRLSRHAPRRLRRSSH